ncbi:cysteine synthase A [Breznakia sp. PF5-3]|uniref:cysteine synthase A n=1 Tax=unclassified Breznakia TaxID=2623764 RepID=UPI002404E43C|nr:MULTISPECIES: cysteine synthase A [unclassified Breznakia]MDL2276848.1 cysteine synthase A [Breznakia sp. OttesenSCG-928-G09]MDF9823942.1 cysteine synthase A [Breznakia sp. PM6-1]MDF9834741.1 cysteine synthase A [Breznakia sp. PF5-3]MDF9836823.1 cysteine synthase A [Breznakia sp. PFB2-8]MDF9858841.1 cysteine synthase A [Breznakia sp. PH5-24]
MKKIYNNITELIGNTPLVRINNLNKGNAEILAKLESFNPGGSVKDRIAYNMIQDALESEVITLDTVIVEPTSGNTGIGLAMVCAALGMKLIIVMPESMSIERRKIIQSYGAELILTPAAGGMKEAIAKAVSLLKENDNYHILQQFENPANPAAHYKTTAEEIYRDTDGKVDIFVAGVGTGGTIIGVGENLKNKLPNMKIVAVEAAKSPVLSGGKPGPHKIQGISAGFVPGVYKPFVVDQIMQVDDDNAIKTSQELAKRDGISVGISSGAALFAALELAKLPENENKQIVVLLADGGERYLSTDLFKFD